MLQGIRCLVKIHWNFDLFKKTILLCFRHKTALLAVEILCGYKSREKEEFEGILPYLFCRNSGFDCELRKLIINSDLVQNNILFKSIIKSELMSVVYSISYDFVVFRENLVYKCTTSIHQLTIFHSSCNFVHMLYFPSGFRVLGEQSNCSP